VLARAKAEEAPPEAPVAEPAPVAVEPRAAPPPRLTPAPRPVAPRPVAPVTATARLLDEDEPPRWAGWTTVAGALALAFTTAALGFSSAADSGAARDTWYASDAMRLNAAARDKAIAANVLGVLSLLGGATGGYLLWRWR
jgi:hypothetical protein